MLTLLTIVCTVGMAQDETAWKSLSFPDDNKANNKCQTYAKHGQLRLAMTHGA